MLYLLLLACGNPVIDDDPPGSSDDTSPQADDTAGPDSDLPDDLPELYINELVASNSDLGVPECEDSDWFEIYNADEYTQNLSGLYLTDDLDEPTKWQISSGVAVESGGYVVFCADDGDDGVHTGFKLSAGGESLGLFASDEYGNARIDAIDYPEMERDSAYARLPDGGEGWGVTWSPTPGEANVADSEPDRDTGEQGGPPSE